MRSHLTPFRLSAISLALLMVAGTVSAQSAPLGGNRFNMVQNGKRMTADDFDQWLASKGIRVVGQGRASTPALNPSAMLAQASSPSFSTASPIHAGDVVDLTQGGAAAIPSTTKFVDAGPAIKQTDISVAPGATGPKISDKTIKFEDAPRMGDRPATAKNAIPEKAGAATQSAPAMPTMEQLQQITSIYNSMAEQQKAAARANARPAGKKKPMTLEIGKAPAPAVAEVDDKPKAPQVRETYEVAGRRVNVYRAWMENSPEPVAQPATPSVTYAQQLPAVQQQPAVYASSAPSTPSPSSFYQGKRGEGLTIAVRDGAPK